MTEMNQYNLETLNDDSVQCLFFSSELESCGTDWQEKCKCINNMIKSMTENYIWHREEFTVYLPIYNSKKDFPLHLISITNFGDNIEDEWFIVHLVLEITKAYADLVVQIKDNDGDFLLIEAADHLPSWANPNRTNNRVFIQGGHIHLISPDVINTETELTIQAAINLICEMKATTRVSMDVEHAIINRIGNYPDKLKTNVHRAILKLPVNIAAILSLQPKLIAPLVGIYCSHDEIEAKCCKNLNLDNCIVHQVTFTKCLYAMLMHSKLISHTRHLIAADSNKMSILGLKLACSFKIIMNKASQDKHSSKEFFTFIKNLKSNGYFKDNIEGSKDYNQLLETAKEYFNHIESPTNLYIANEISKIMSSEEFRNMKQTLITAKNDNLHEDNDEWLNIHPDQLNELLNTRYGKPAEFKSDDVISSQTVISQLSNFLKTTSDYEGIESGSETESDDNIIDFDANQFDTCIEKMLNLLSEGSNEQHMIHDDLDDSEINDEGLDMSQNNEMDYLDKEVADKLLQDKPLQNSDFMLSNIKQSMREEKASSGPSSNLLISVGIKKTDLLDSDDDDDE